VPQNEVRFIFIAASRALRAADYLHGLQGAHCQIRHRA
jgi:hypothetical protein